MTEGAIGRVAVESSPAPLGRRYAAMRLRPRFGWALTQIVLDFVTVLAASTATYSAYIWLDLGLSHFDPALYTKVGVAFAGLTVFALHGTGEYSRNLGLLRIESIRRIILGVSYGLLLTLALTFLVQLPNFSRLTLLMVGPVTVGFLTFQRFATWMVQDRSAAARRKPVLIYGAGETGRLLAQHLLQEHQLGMVPVGFLDDDVKLHRQDLRVGAGEDGERLLVFGGEADLEHILDLTKAEAVFVALPSAPPAKIGRIVGELESRGVAFFCVPGAGDFVFSSLSFGQIGGTPVFTRKAPTSDRPYETLKRLIDFAGAAVLLTVTSPLILLGAALIKLTSPGPVFFKQKRVGLQGKQFTIYKLRTMNTEAPRYAYNPTAQDDARITRIGRLLRKTSIDELPQLYNVLRGEMSLVGPRPEMPFIVRDYTSLQRLRLTVKPGITGLWQISADRAYQIHHNMHYDLYYVEHRSLLLDVAIVLMTPLVLLAKNRAV